MDVTQAGTRQSHFQGETLDDLMRCVIEEILCHGVDTNPKRGGAAELTGVLLELSNPRARLSQTETRGKLFSCLGELCWYLAKSNAVDFISYYIPPYKEEAEGDIIYGGYGPRLFDFRRNDQIKTHDQIENVVKLLKERPSTRRAVIQLFDASDLAEEHKEVPCTCSLQFLARSGALHMFTAMRSNDVFLGLPHDVFCFSMLQEIVARTVGLEVGVYKHAVGSLHLYERNRSAAQDFINEGWQSTDQPMPAMPATDPWQSVATLVAVEAKIRSGEGPDEELLRTLDPYWADLVRLLYVFALSKRHDAARMQALLNEMSSNVFDAFITAKVAALEVD